MQKTRSKLTTTAILLCIVSALLLPSCGQKEIHGEDLLNLSDARLYEQVYIQTLDLVWSYEDEETALASMSDACRTVYVLSIFDMEIQNGGLCQFFVNPSRLLAPYVDECLETVQAYDHQALFSEFVTDNQIDLTHLESFAADNVGEYAEQAKCYDFDAFDRAYVALTPLQNSIVTYIKAHIEEF